MKSTIVSILIIMLIALNTIAFNVNSSIMVSNHENDSYKAQEKNTDLLLNVKSKEKSLELDSPIMDGSTAEIIKILRMCNILALEVIIVYGAAVFVVCLCRKIERKT